MVAGVKKTRIDRLLVERGIVESREKARALVMAGHVLVGDVPVLKAGTPIDVEAPLRVRQPSQTYVSRGGLKLEGAIRNFRVTLDGCIAADIGASTGGFTDCLLRAGVLRVYAVDVDTTQLDWRLRRNERVRTVEMNARYLEATSLPETVDFVAVDVSFISVRKILPVLPAVLGPAGDVMVLVKPQFEVGRSQVGRGGIVKDPVLHEQAVRDVQAMAVSCGFTVEGICPSPITGKRGNQEFFLWLRRP